MVTGIEIDEARTSEIPALEINESAARVVAHLEGGGHGRLGMGHAELRGRSQRPKAPRRAESAVVARGARAATSLP